MAALTLATDGGCRAKLRGAPGWQPRSGVALGPLAELILSGAFQASAAASWCLWSFIRLCVAVIRRYSERAADLPRLSNWLMRRLCSSPTALRASARLKYARKRQVLSPRKSKMAAYG
jgi:hypothetical protein